MSMLLPPGSTAVSVAGADGADPGSDHLGIQDIRCPVLRNRFELMRAGSPCVGEVETGQSRKAGSSHEGPRVRIPLPPPASRANSDIVPELLRKVSRAGTP